MKAYFYDSTENCTWLVSRCKETELACFYICSVIEKLYAMKIVDISFNANHILMM